VPYAGTRHLWRPLYAKRKNKNEMIKIFTSWSGEKSKKVALALKEWIPDIIQNVELWVSDQDINAGSRWNDELNIELEQNYFGIICLTSENLEKPWILFEAGSLSKSLAVSKVIPFRLDVSAIDIKPPLSQFQGVDSDREGTYKLLVSINKVLKNPIENQRLERLFNKFWGDLEAKLIAIKEITPQSSSARRNERDYLEEILTLVRDTNSSFGASHSSKQQEPLPEEERKFIIKFIFDRLRNKNLTELKEQELSLFRAFDDTKMKGALRASRMVSYWIELLKENEENSSYNNA